MLVSVELNLVDVTEWESRSPSSFVSGLACLDTVDVVEDDVVDDDDVDDDGLR